MPRSSVLVLISLMAVTTLSGILAWGLGVTFVHHGRGTTDVHPAVFLVVCTILGGLILAQKTLGWLLLLMLSVVQLAHEILNVMLSEPSYTFLQWPFVGGAVATAVYCFANRIHFDW